MEYIKKAEELLERFGHDKQLSIKVAESIMNESKSIFHSYGLGYTGGAFARNDFTQSNLYNFWTKVINYIQSVAP